MIESGRTRLHEIIVEADTPAGKAFDVALLVSMRSMRSCARCAPRLTAVRRPLAYAKSFFGVVLTLVLIMGAAMYVIEGQESGFTSIPRGMYWAIVTITTVGSCINLVDDDCDTFQDGADPDCAENPYCVVVTAGAGEPSLSMDTGSCGGAELSGPFDVIRGFTSQLNIAGGSVDLGAVVCVAGNLAWDRVTDLSADPNPACNDPAVFYLAKDSSAADYGAASSAERRDTMNPDPACP